MKTVIRAGIALGAGKPLRKVYVGLQDSKIDVVSHDELTGYEDAELDIGGWDRIVSPGFITIHTYLSLYPFRFRIFTGRENANLLLSTFSSNDSYYFALLGAYHLLKQGVTTVGFSGNHLDIVARAVSEVGLRPIIIVSVGCSNSPSDWEKEFRTLFNRWSHKGANNVILKVCDQSLLRDAFELAKENEIAVLVDNKVYLTEDIDYDQIIGLGGGSRLDLDVIRKKRFKLSFTPSYEVSKFPLSEYKPSVSLDLVPSFDIRHELAYTSTRLLLTAEEAFHSMTDWGYSQLKMNSGVLNSGYTADLVIFQYSEPPAFPLDIVSPYETLMFSSYSLETVIVNGEPVLDGGLPLNVGLKDVEEGVRRLEEIDRKTGERTRSLEKG